MAAGRGLGLPGPAPWATRQGSRLDCRSSPLSPVAVQSWVSSLPNLSQLQPSPRCPGLPGVQGRCRAGGGSGRGPSHWVIKAKGSLTAGCVAALGGPSGGGEGAQAVQLQVLAASPNSPDTMDPHLMLKVLQEVGRLRRRGLELAPFAVVERTLSGERGDPPPPPPVFSW